MNNVDDETLSPGAVKRKKKNAENHVNAWWSRVEVGSIIIPSLGTFQDLLTLHCAKD